MTQRFDLKENKRRLIATNIITSFSTERLMNNTG
jgi:hypothetical protein